MKKLTIKTNNKLEKYVKQWINNKVRDYDSGTVKGVIEDLLQAGCISGYVCELIYYTDTIKFFKKYKTEINELLKEAISNCGNSISDVFGDK